MPMMRIALLAAPALVLAACSVTTAPDNAEAPAPAPGATPGAAASPTETPAPAPTPVAAAAAKPVEPRTFGDWAVGCDNTALCTMASLGVEGTVPDGVTMQILRQPGPEGAFDLAFDEPAEERAVAPTAVEIDGRRLPLSALNGAPAAAIVRAMVDAGSLVAIRPTGRATISLKGAAAALRWIDAQQGRAGTVTAAVATGPKPASAVPERRPAPVVRALVATGVAAKPTRAQLAAMQKQAGCELPDGAVFQPEAHALGGGATLVLLPCFAGAYNLSSALYVLRDGTFTVARTDAPTGFGPTGAADLDKVASVVNGTWKDGELTSYAKGRGLGDCGVSQTMVWDGTRFRLTEQAEMGECRGNPNYITTWRTQVVRG